MDRSPAWMGLYRFVVQGWPLADALREIERHRGLRPKASVTLLYNRVLPRLAPIAPALDPTVPILRECRRGDGRSRGRGHHESGLQSQARLPGAQEFACRAALRLGLT